MNLGSIYITQERKRIIIENLKEKELASADEQSNTVNLGNPLQVSAPEEKQQDYSKISLQQDFALTVYSIS